MLRRIRKRRPEQANGREKQGCPTPPPQEEGNSSGIGEKTEPDMASYYAAAAAAASTGYEFPKDDSRENDSAEATSESDNAQQEDSAGQAGSDASQEKSISATGEDAPEAAEENNGADISDDGSPHGPLNLFAEGAGEPSEDRNEKAESRDEKKEEEKPASSDVPAFAAFQAPEKPEEKKDAYDDEEEGAEDDVPMSIMGHLNELRRRLFRIVIIVILGFVAFYGVSEALYGFLSAPLQACMPEGSKLIYTSPQGAFFTYMKVALVASLFGTSPFSFYQIWAFIAPGLYREEKRAVLPLAFFSSIFFLAGAAFCFFLVFPIAFKFFMGFATETIVPMISVEEYLSFALKLLIAFGLVFEMPLFAYFLSRFGLLTPEFMRRTRRYAILVIFIVAAILTPPDVFSQCLMALPMLLLYEVSIYVSAVAYKKKDSGKPSDNAEEKKEA